MLAHPDDNTILERNHDNKKSQVLHSDKQRRQPHPLQFCLLYNYSDRHWFSHLNQCWDTKDRVLQKLYMHYHQRAYANNREDNYLNSHMHLAYRQYRYLDKMDRLEEVM